jgi:hypothetical protein
MSDDRLLAEPSDAQILQALKLEASGLQIAIAAIDEAGRAMDAANATRRPHRSNIVVDIRKHRVHRTHHGK